MIQSKSAGHAKSYFSDALSKSDYYTNDQELGGRWRGKLAQRLGLKGDTDKDAFFALCENRHPQTNAPLTPRMKQDRTTGYDINFHCPKSVSVMHVLTKDDQILKAFEASVGATMSLIEQDSKTRVRAKGKSEDRQTGELVWGQFVHQTARPVDGSPPDPHLHAHCFVFNATWDETEQKMKAGQFRDINRDMPFYQAYFHKELADRLSEQGYAIRKTEKSFEIDNVPKEVIRLFSKRTNDIGRIAKEKGITDAKELGDLGARTRSKKQKGMSMDELANIWQQQIDNLKPGEKDGGKEDIQPAPVIPTPGITAQQCIDHAVLHCFERVSVMPDRKLLQEAYRFGLGEPSISLKEIDYRFNNDTRILHIEDAGKIVCTTKEVLAEEKRMVDLARKGQGQIIPLYSTAPQISLFGQQADAISHVLTTSDRVSIIRGAAGAGKTTLMKEAVEKIEEAGKTVTVVAPTAKASRGVLKEEGFEDANTVAKLLTDPSMQEKLKGQVLWVDEAGLLGTKDMLNILEIVHQQDARLILGGDTRQHAAVVRGDALRILNTVGGIKPAEVNKIYRQEKQEYRAAVEDLSKGEVGAAFEKLGKINFIKTVDPENPNKALIDDYIAAVKAGKTTLVIAPTHAQGDALTHDIRERLRAEGLIGKKEIAVSQFKNLNLTEAEKKDHRNFEEGQTVIFNQNARGFVRGSVWVVDKTFDNQVAVINEEGDRKILPTDKSKRFDVFDNSDAALSKNDKVRITRNSFDLDGKRMDNGDEFTIQSVSKFGGIILQNKKSKNTARINQEFGHLTYAHCITSHASQGATVQAVFISQPTNTFPATDAKQFYVSVSRGKEYAFIYTDDKEALLEHASNLRERQSAMELVETSKQKELALAIQRKSEVQKLVPALKPPSKQFEKDYVPDI